MIEAGTMELFDQYTNAHGDNIQIMFDGTTYKIWNSEWAVPIGYTTIEQVARIMAEIDVEEFCND